jgi:aldehyde:ferredoxin oxidoreductase
MEVKLSGSFHKLLEIDLSSESVATIDIDPTYSRAYVGGSTLGARLFFDRGGAEADPLSPNNPLFVMAGPLVGTNFPGSSRFVMCAGSPLTGLWGESASGGAFGAELKATGVDGVAIMGKAEKPSYILVDDQDVSILDADDLWGLDTYETVEKLREKHSGDRSVKVLAIGPAGERMVKFASVCNDKAHYFGRTGMGAVMGSKNLKAIVVRGNAKIPIADEEAYKAVRKATLETIKDSMISDSFHSMGTTAAMDLGMMTGDVPIKNWSVGVDYEMGEALGGPSNLEKLVKGRKSCRACPIGCKPVVEVTIPEYAVPKGPGPEYETCASFGTMLMNDNLFAVAKANELCNRLGMDTITCGATLSFIMEAYERELLTADDMDGIEMKWGDMDAVMKMVNKIALREGFGDRAAEGSRTLAQSLGAETEEFLVEIKGLELPMHDPRGFHGMGLAYMNSNRGACHLQHSDQAVELGMVSWGEVGLKDDYEGPASEGKAEMVYVAENVGQMANALCICHFVNWAMGLQNLLDGFNAVTGYGFGFEEFQEVGKRSWVLKRALNNIMGVTSKDDRLPRRVLTPLDEGGAAGSVPDEALLKRDYYEIRGLEENGFPSPQLLRSLGLEYVQEKLYH